MATPSLSPGVLNDIYIASAGLYKVTSEFGSLARLTARVEYPGVDSANRPAAPVKNLRSVTAKFRLTFHGGVGPGQFQAEYSCVGEERDSSTSASASLQFPGGEARTSPNRLSPPGWLSPVAFKYEQPLEVSLILRASAIADVHPRHPGPIQMAAESRLVGITGVGASADPHPPLSFLWEPLEIQIHITM